MPTASNPTQARDARLRDTSPSYHQPKTVEELTEQNIRTIIDMDDAAKEKRTRLDRAIDAITNFCGHMAFVWVHLIWFTVWIALNIVPHRLGSHAKPFDPFPFQFLTLTVSLEAIFLSAFILISQNRQQELSERRSHLDLQINLLTEQENTKMLQLLSQIANKVGVKIEGDPTVQVLEEATRPDKLVEQIEQRINQQETAGDAP